MDTKSLKQEPLTREEVKKFNETIMHMKKEEKDECLLNLKKITVDTQMQQYIRSVINSK